MSGTRPDQSAQIQVMICSLELDAVAFKYLAKLKKGRTMSHMCVSHVFINMHHLMSQYGYEECSGPIGGQQMNFESSVVTMLTIGPPGQIHVTDSDIYEPAGWQPIAKQQSIELSIGSAYRSHCGLIHDQHTFPDGFASWVFS